jgi:glutathione-regulated potassium-efflux system ancillary protein KefG
METLVIVAHPQLEDSSTQQFLRQAAKPLEKVMWHPVPKTNELDITAEQTSLRQADRIIFQFPLYWYSAPANLKIWEDAVLTRHFADQAVDGALVGKELGLVISLGTPERHYAAGQPENVSLSQLTVPFQALAHKLGMTFLPTLVVDQFGYQSETEKMQLLVRYQRYLTQESLGHFKDEEAWLLTRFQDYVATLPAEQQTQASLLLDQLTANRDQLAELQATVKMMQDTEDF